MGRQYTFKKTKLTSGKVELDRKILDDEIIGLFLKENIRFHYEPIVGKIKAHNKETRSLKRFLNANSNNFKVDEEGDLLLKDRNSPTLRQYTFKKFVFVVYANDYFDIVEEDLLGDYLKRFSFDTKEEENIRKNKSLVLQRTNTDTNNINIDFKD